jgi:hypothetical protein
MFEALCLEVSRITSLVTAVIASLADRRRKYRQSLLAPLHADRQLNATVI